MRNDVAEKLAAVDLFAGLSSRHVKRVAAAGKVIEHAPGKTVATEGEGGLAFHLILDGEFDVTVHGNHVHTLKAGDFFGEISMIDGKPRTATVVARSSASCFALPRAAFSQILEAEPAVAHALLVALATRLRDAGTQT